MVLYYSFGHNNKRIHTEHTIVLMAAYTQNVAIQETTSRNRRLLPGISALVSMSISVYIRVIENKQGNILVKNATVAQKEKEIPRTFKITDNSAEQRENRFVYF
jgi:hypothetical protein